MVEEINYKPDGEIKSNYLYTYDEKGNKIKRTHDTEAKNHWDYTTYYFYDKEEKLIKVGHPISDESDALWYSSIFKYDEMGNKIENWGMMPDGTMSELKTSYKYDDKNNITEIIITGIPALNHHSFYIYEYDKQGNWIKKTSSLENKIPVNTEERVIEYY
jgi:hypothetical protein